MKNNSNYIKVGVTLLCLGWCLITVFISVKDQKANEADRQSECRKKKKEKRPKKTSETSQKYIKNSKELTFKQDVITDISEQGKEQEELTEEQSQILESIQEAFNNEDKMTLLGIVQRLQKTKGWPTLFPLEIRQEAIDAMSWFGYDCLSEAIMFLADPDEDVVQTATKMFNDAVEDEDLNDEKRANVLLIASDVLKDADALESMLFELNNMRNSVAVNTLKRLLKSENPVTLKLLPEAISSFTGEEGVDTPEKLDAWLRDNPDEEE